jgi:CRISPR-associated protein Csm1
MSVQILLQGKITGTEEFPPAGAGPESELAGRANWVGLLSEVLPRALIAELNLSKMLLGASGAGQFLVVLPEESRATAEEFLKSTRAGIRSLSEGRVELLWAITENLGDWTVVRKRLTEEMNRKQGAPLAHTGFAAVEEFESAGSYFSGELAGRLRDASIVGWSPEEPGRIQIGAGKHTWSIGSEIPLARHTALNDDGREPATTAKLAQRAEGRPLWGVLRGDVDNFGIRIRRVQSIEEHVQLSVLYKQFFAGELEVLCSMPEFWRKVTLLYAGGDDFAIYGAWDALIGFAREMQRVFRRFSEEQLKEFPGPEGKTITMAITLAPDERASLASLYESAGEKLEMAKAADKDCLYLLGRTLEWKQLSDAAQLRDELMRMIRDYGAPADYIRELTGLYRETRRPEGERSTKRPERPWRLHRRLTRILSGSRSREFQKARAGLIADLAGKNPAHRKLRPSSRVALEWARLSAEGPES